MFVSGTLDAAVILPHGDYALDPSLLPATTKSRRIATKIHVAARQVGYEWLDQTINPDLILLMSPHGIALTRDFGIYLGSTASGDVELGKDNNMNRTLPNNRTVVHFGPIRLEPRISQKLVDELSDTFGMNVSGIQFSPGDDSVDTPLHWGEVIPLSLIEGQRDDEKTTSRYYYQRRRHVIFTSPLRRHTQQPVTMVSELLELGRRIRNFLDHNLPKTMKVAVVVSADLSHTHRPDGPYGYSATSAVNDAALVKWASNPCRNADALLMNSTELQSRALACGYTGFVILHGMLCGHHDDGSIYKSDHLADDDAAEWDAQVVANGNATYYGMMVARFSRRQRQKKASAAASALPRRASAAAEAD